MAYKTKQRVVSPPINELGSLRTPLEDGEKQVLEFFLTRLPPEWEIYIQPHLNGLRPDFVLLNPQVGIAVFEVKDWNLKAMQYFVDPSTKHLMASNSDRTFSIQSSNPVPKISLYKRYINELFCPRMNHKAGNVVITAGIIFPMTTTQRVEDLLMPLLIHERMRNDPEKQSANTWDPGHYYPVSGGDALRQGFLEAVFPEASRRRSDKMEPHFAADLRSWLVEPSLSSEQRKPLPLDAQQRQLAITRTPNGYRRIKGPAGSGKTLVLAARVGEMVEQEKTFLVVSFNITLLHYIQDMAVRYSEKSRKARVVGTWWNFHQWCRMMCEGAGFRDEYLELFKAYSLEEVFAGKMPALVNKIIDSATEPFDTYDAIFVDEGQDFNLIWWNTLRRVLKPGGEIVLVADTTQDIYGTARQWTEEAMNNAGFRGGRWAELQFSYRMPNDYIPFVRDYASRFVPDELRTLPELHQLENELPGAFPVFLRWVNCEDSDPVVCCCSELLHLLKRDVAKGIAVADVVFLSSSINIGLLVVEEMQNGFGYGFHHTFSEDDMEARDLKKAFFLGDAKAKATTIHSFKGYESRTLLIYIDNNHEQSLAELIYVALTRLREDTAGSHITVVCNIPKMNEYGASWPNYEKGVRDLPLCVKSRKRPSFDDILYEL